jgi:hypothetical protein
LVLGSGLTGTDVVEERLVLLSLPLHALRPIPESLQSQNRMLPGTDLAAEGLSTRKN